MDVKEAGFLSHVEAVSRTKVRGVLAILKQAEIIQKCGVVGEAVQLYLDEKITNFGMLRERHDKFLKDYMLENFMNIPEEYRAELLWQIDDKKRQDRLVIVGALVGQLQVIANQKRELRFPEMTATSCTGATATIGGTSGGVGGVEDMDNHSFTEEERRSSTTDTGNESDSEYLKETTSAASSASGASASWMGNTGITNQAVSWTEAKQTLFDFHPTSGPSLLPATSYDMVGEEEDFFALWNQQEGAVLSIPQGITSNSSNSHGSRYEEMFTTSSAATHTMSRGGYNGSSIGMGGGEEGYYHDQGDDFVMDELLQSIIDE